MSAVMCGPMLRHVSQKQVFVWLVLDSLPDSIDAIVMDGDGRVVGNAALDSLTAVQAGKNLFFYRLALTPIAGTQFLSDVLYYYDIVINDRDLRAQHKLEGLRYLGLKEGQRPSFFLPAIQTNILQASCRRPHATIDGIQNVPDQLIEACLRVERCSDDLSKRPSQLFLTGDQIYADDVSVPMGMLCTQFADYLVGEEEMPGPVKGSPTVLPSQVRLLKRDQYIKPSHGFSTTERGQHLMSFGEYVSMHFMTWGGGHMSVEDLPSYEQIKSRIPKKRVARGPKGKRVLVSAYSEKEYQRDRKIIETFLSTTHYARRLMANVPTYMMFDDHEVTDDWNLTEKVRDQLSNNPFSRRLVSNALAAYWLCQHWGNESVEIDKGEQRQIKECFVAKSHDALMGLEACVLSRYWAYSIPTNPPVLVLDTRTKRHFSKQGLALISPQGFSFLRSLIGELSVIKSATLVLVSPTPVFGFSSIESLQLGLPRQAAAVFDSEPWLANDFALALLKHELAALNSLKHVVILSGDVHYSFGRLERDRLTVEERDIHYYQLCSSPSCNIAPGRTMGQWVLENILDCDVFHKAQTKYLLPEPDVASVDYSVEKNIERNVSKRQQFITSDTNVGAAHFRIDEGGNVCPESAELYCTDFDLGRYVWRYDLITPKFHEIN